MSPGSVDEAKLMAPRALAQRACGECTVCCTVMPVVELRKPGRRACESVTPEGCAIHPDRPASCREFHCLWLRGAINGDGDQHTETRPDVLGVMFDAYALRGETDRHIVAIELWAGAIESQRARAIVTELSQIEKVAISRRDGRWSVVEKTEEKRRV